MTSIEHELPAVGRAGADASGPFDVDGLEAATDVDLVAASIGWLSGDISALTGAADAVLDEALACDLTTLSPGELREVADRWESIATRVEATRVALAGEVERRGHERDRGFFSTRALIEHRHQLSRSSSLARTQTMRMLQLLPSWKTAVRDGTVGIDQTHLMGRVAANPRITDALVERADDLLHDARQLPYRQFVRRVRMLERLADTESARRVDERNRDRRNVTLTQLPDGSWRLRGRLSAVDGAEINEIFAHFINAEAHTDLAALDTDNETGGPLQLARTEPQRRADALLAIARSAATAPNGRSTPLPTLNVLIDIDTLQATINNEPIPTSRSRDIVCRTERGHHLPLDEAAAMTLWAHVRRVVVDGAGTVIDLGRRQRLFRGTARDAIRLLHETCVWPGCTIAGVDSEADHARTWRTHGATTPDNGLPLCTRHNQLKQRGHYTTRRDTNGNWQITDPNGRTLD